MVSNCENQIKKQYLGEITTWGYTAALAEVCVLRMNSSCKCNLKLMYTVYKTLLCTTGDGYV